MRIFLKLILAFFSASAFGVCGFKKNVNGVISLSGSSTILLKEFGLLKHPKLKGISVFNPVLDKEFTGKAYPGGIFLSHQSMEDLKGSFLIYDESRELKRIFETRKEILSREIRTRNMTPNAAIDSTLNVLNEILEGCDKEVSELRKKISLLQNEILKVLTSQKPMVFYLGEFAHGRRPEMLMVNDGIVKWLVENKKIKTYPSELAYVNWSSKILSSMPPETLHIGIKDSGRSGQKEIKRSPLGMTLIYGGSLVPGLSQLEAFLFLFKSL